MRGREEKRLVGRRRQVHAVLEETVEDALETLPVGGVDVFEASDGRRPVGEEEAQHRAHALGAQGDAVLAGAFTESLLELGTGLLELRISFPGAFLQDLKVHQQLLIPV